MEHSLLLFSSRIVAILCVLLLGLGFFRAAPQSGGARLFLLLSVCVACYLLGEMSMPQVEAAYRLQPGVWGVFLNLGSNATPGVFMLYCHRTFQDDRRAPWPLGLLLLVQLVLDHLNYRSYRPSPFLSVEADSTFVQWLIGPVPDVVQLFFAALALYWTARGWRSDLVENRRLLRWVIVGVQAILLLVIVVLENFLLGEAPSPFLQASISYVLALLSVLLLVSVQKVDYVALGQVIRKVTPFVQAEPADGALDESLKVGLDRFRTMFEDNRLYREHGLTIADLARKLELPEYRLRALINKHLGYRNFNALLHKYRIEDASRMLADPAQRHLPVLTIALTVGYQSITPFNSAFRLSKGVTPTEFRRQALQSATSDQG